jgi:ABC-2 type transport system ATP-binding protein
MIMGILNPDEGRVSLLGSDPDVTRRTRVGYLPEERGVYKKMKCLELIMFLGEIRGVKRAEGKRRGLAWMERLGLSSWADKRVEDLSKGMQQKIQFIGTVLHQPEVLILDEPFSGLDPVNTNLMKDVVLDLNRKGTTVVFSAHVMEQVERMCEAICLINKGKVVVEGRLAEVKQRYGTNAVVLGFEGDGSFLRQLPVVERVDLHGNYAEMRIREGADPSSILEAAMAKVKVRRFEVVEPTLNSIFIDLVGGTPEEALGRPPDELSNASEAGVAGSAHV